MKLGFVSAILPELSLHEVVAFAREAGYSCVEIMCWPVSKAERRYAGVTHIDVANLTKAHADGIREVFETAGVELSGLGYYPNPLSGDRDEAQACIKHLQKVIRAAPLLGCDRVNTFVGRDWTKSVDDNWPQFRKVWKPLLALADQQQVYIGIENCPMSFTQDEWPGGKNLATSPAIWHRMFEEFPTKHFGLNFDPSHFVWQQMDYIKPLKVFKDRLFHIHAKDVRIDRERLDYVGILATPLEYHVPKIPGLGEVNWGRFFSVLGDVGYTGPVCVEVEDRAFEGSLESRQAALHQSATYLRNFVAG
jgi:sugar phosphate isomerase/epimerase